MLLIQSNLSTVVWNLTWPQEVSPIQRCSISLEASPGRKLLLLLQRAVCCPVHALGVCLLYFLT